MGSDWELSTASCKEVRDRNSERADQDTCRGNPIYPLTGAKSKAVALSKLPGLSIELSYSTRKALVGDGYFGPGEIMSAPAGAGPLWTLNIQKELYNGSHAQLYLGNDKWELLSPGSGGTLVGESIGPDLQVLAQGYEWSVADKLAGLVYQFSPAGSGWSPTVVPLQSLQHIDGTRFDLQQATPGTATAWRSITQVNQLTDAFGRSVTFQYERPSAAAATRLKALTDANGTITFTYNDKGMLSRITWPDATYQEFLYEAGQDDKPWLLTGVRDENQALTAQYGYDAQGRAVSTQLSGGVDRYAVNQWQTTPGPTTRRWYDAAAGVIWRETSWSDPAKADLQTPNSASSTMQTTMVKGVPRLTSQTQPAGAGCAASVQRQDYDVNGNVAWMEDFNAHRTCYANNLSRNLETSRVEGLATGAACATALADGAALPAGSRKISSQWHPVWRQETRIAEPGRIATFVYNGQPDPLNGGATAHCAPSNGTLLDGSPIVVLCKRVEQATTDPDGHLGFGAALQSSVPSRVWQYSYNQYGQVLTATDPVNNTTNYTYYSSTTPDHTNGDLQSVTNALQQSSQFTKYNPMGQVLESIDQNQITTTYTYDLRQRLKSTSTAGAVTMYDYWPTGLLKQVTQADGSFVVYAYDDAHRLIKLNDQLGNSIAYTLDNSGNRTAEQIVDPSGVLGKQLGRVMDALGRVQQTLGRE